mmetsp:Transcript_24994/g.36943  ORF Transcript_24994/g.36943 Transcript_24994/m.36943 type:complete len:829 (+) Transcript_24994:211-2697(+)|eukprot:CAMPEP_0194230212 /NCGR_PEP_ID=MMETSP0156-20130528/44292_1 /TAXON_ID=33649 /ORGANISM="Thalassionema nitzschioides, Strain L26-B" /LENGTH=828 /DNA_ID=CAMNT_0038962787 /DNA_START=109 /DNA_END=2595 /DNA_ORIENTATION=-
MGFLLQQYNCTLPGVSYGSSSTLPPLVGVACAGSCYEEYASVWSDVAIAHGNRPISNPDGCHSLCRDYGDKCDVWTYWYLEQKCELFQSAITTTAHDYSKNNDVLSFHDESGDKVVVTSPINCYSTVWLPYLQPTTKAPLPQLKNDGEEAVPNTVSNECWISDGGAYSYGVADDGACQDAEMIAVYAPSFILELGLTQQWWGSARIVPTTNSIITEYECQQKCDDTTNSICGGWQWINTNVCILKSRLDCTPTVARIRKSSSFRSSTAGVRGCIDLDSDLAEEQNALTTNNCKKVQRCTEPQYDEEEGGSSYWFEDTFLPGEEKNCYYQYLTPQELRQGCLQNRWMVITGASNVMSFYVQLIQLFTKIEPKGPLDPFISFGLTFAYSLMDVVFDETGSIIYINTKQFCEIDPNLRCGGSLVFQAGKMDWSPEYPAALQKALSEAPSGTTRVTMVMGHIWSHVARTLDSLQQQQDSYSNGWGDAKIMFYGQAMIWYPCFLEKWCKDSAMGSTNEEVLSKFQIDVDDMLQVGQRTCATDRFDCFFASHGYGGPIGPRAQSMMDILKEALAPYEWAYYIDYNPILRATYRIVEKGVVDGHLLPAIMVISQTMIWNTICPALPRTVCPEAIQMAPTCWADCEARIGGGGSAAEQSCNNCDSEDWMCMSSRQCDYDVLSDSSSSTLLQLEGGGGGKRDQIPMECFNSKTIGIPYTPNGIIGTTRNTNEDTCDDQRIWCGTTADSWIVSCVIFTLGLSVTLFGDKLWDYILLKFQKKKKPPPVDDGAFSEDDIQRDEDSDDGEDDDAVQLDGEHEDVHSDSDDDEDGEDEIFNN